MSEQHGTQVSACDHEDRHTFHGVVAWQCSVCGHTKPRVPEQRRDVLEERIAAVHAFAAERERRADLETSGPN